MDYRKYVSSSNVEFKVNDHLTQPSFSLNVPAMAVVAAGLVAAGFIAAAVEDLKTRKATWDADKAKTQRQHAVWQHMRNNPPVLYSLMLETNAGTKPLFYSMDEEQIRKVNAAIKRAMEKKEGGDIHFNIETVNNVGGPDSINNFGSTIYSQTLQNA